MTLSSIICYNISVMKYEYITQQGDIEILEGTELTPSITVSSITSLYQDRLTPNFNFKGEKHNLYELFYLASGKMKITTDKGNFSLSANEYIIIPPNVFHAMNPDKCYTVSISVTFDACGLDDELITLKTSKLDDKELLHLNTVVESYEDHFAYKWGVILPVESFMKNEYAYRQIIKNEIEILLIMITRDFLRQRNFEEKNITLNNNNIAEKIKEYVDAHYTEKLQLESIAASLGYCKEHICRVFKKKYNVSIIHYMLQQRIAKSLFLLEREDKTLQNVSDELGFDSVQYFIKTFKRFTNTTPKQYQQIAKRTHIMNINQFLVKSDPK